MEGFLKFLEIKIKYFGFKGAVLSIKVSNLCWKPN